MKTVIKIRVNRALLLRDKPAIAIHKEGHKVQYTRARELLNGSVIKQKGKHVWVEEYEHVRRPRAVQSYQSKAFERLNRFADEIGETNPSRKRRAELSNMLRDLAFAVTDA